MTEPTLRQATRGDADALRRLIHPILREYGLQPDPQGVDADLDDVERHYGDAGGAFWVLESGDEVIGSVGLYPLGGGVVELRKMYLDRAHRGRGLGRRLLEHALDEARSRGYSELRLETASALVEAIALYKRYGFTRVPRELGVPRCDQTWSLAL